MNDTKDQLTNERVFHDNWASEIDFDKIDVDIAFEGSTAPENRFILSFLGDIRGKYLLDLGCGAGESSVYFAKKGAKVVAGDLSPGMLTAAKHLADIYGVDIEGHIVNAMSIDFPEDTFDIVYVSNILHHVDPNKSLGEIHRVLKPGGLACMWEPLKHNPIINIYRRIATEVRTKDEHPLDIRFVETVKDLFSSVEYDTFWFATLWILIRFYIVEKVNPNKERYWKKIIYEESRLRRSYYTLEKIDNLIKKVPFLKRFAWTIAITAIK